MTRRWVAVAATLVCLSGMTQTGPAGPSAYASQLADARISSASDRTAARGVTLASIRHRMVRLERRIRGYERSMNRMDKWFTCIHHIRVDQVGDAQHRWGYHYDEHDGTGLDTRTALTRHHGPGRPKLLLLRVSRSRGCLSHAPDPNGTGEDARVRNPRLGNAELGDARVTARPHRTRLTISSLERRLERLEARVDRVESDTERFDEWESCLSWLPVTEYGHEDQNLGYLVDDPGTKATTGEPNRHFAALDIDSSEWDDPDYELLAFLGRDRPFVNRECGHEPGEDVDRQVVRVRAPIGLQRTAARGGPSTERLEDLLGDVRDAGEDVEDLLEPVLEFVQFDECMFTVGVQDRPGFRYRTAAGKDTHVRALSFDMTGPRLPDFDVMAFPGEEPPQIECNEDAAGENTDE